MPPTIEFAFDYASPWSFLANATLKHHFGDAHFEYLPVYLRGFSAFSQGLPYSPAKMSYLLKDFVRSAAHVRVEVRMPPVFPINGIHALRAAIAAKRLGGFPELHAALFHAAWQDERDISDKNVVAELARSLALGEVAAAIDDPSVKDALRKGTEAVIERGAFGVPTFFVGDEMFWGHDRMHFAAATFRPSTV
ncbi:MAG: 2-hydroxychromene-2-carboxylate isomerase [Polyangiales bacterium]